VAGSRRTRQDHRAQQPRNPVHDEEKDREDDYYDDDDSPAFGISRKGQPKKKKKMGMLGDLFEF